MRRLHPEANHHVYAYRVSGGRGPSGTAVQRFSDDREPSGTAGKPVLDVISGQDLYDAMIVVVRYFGGTLLGTGGLVHAYGTAASLSVHQAGIAEVRPYARLMVHLAYTDLGKVQHSLEKEGYGIEDIRYLEEVVMTVLCGQERVRHLEELLQEISAGRLSVSEKHLVAASLCDGKVMQTKEIDFDEVSR